MSIKNLVPLCLPLACLFPLLSIAGQSAAAPFALAVEVDYDDEGGAESLRDEIQRHIIHTIEEARCYEELQRYESEGNDTPADLLVRVGIRDVESRERWETSLAERTSPTGGGDPMEQQRRVVAEIEFDVRLEMLALPEALRLRVRGYHHNASYRPRTTEDARNEVRRMAIDDLAREVRGFACKGTKRLPREIERVRKASDD